MLETYCKASALDYNRLEKPIHLFLFVSKSAQGAKKNAKKTYDLYECRKKRVQWKFWRIPTQ